MGNGQHILKNTNMNDAKCNAKFNPIIAHEYVKDIRNIYIGDNTTTDFNITFPYFTKEDINVYINGNDIPATSYKIHNGIIKFDTAPTKGSEIKIEAKHDLFNKYKYQDFNMNKYDELMDNLNKREDLKYGVNLMF